MPKHRISGHCLRAVAAACIVASASPAIAVDGCLQGDPADYYSAWGREDLYALLIPQVLEYHRRDGIVPWDCLASEFDALGDRFWVERSYAGDGVGVAYRFTKQMLNPLFFLDPTRSPGRLGQEFAPFMVWGDAVSIIEEQGNIGRDVWLISE